MRLNPFFIRSAVEILATTDTDLRVGLNPFFIRSAVEIQRDGRRRSPAHVLIPSSSGLRLKFVQGEAVAPKTRLNPFFIRSAVEMVEMGYCGDPREKS